MKPGIMHEITMGLALGLGLLSAATFAAVPAAAKSATPAASLVAVLPGNGDTVAAPVMKVGLTYSAPVELQALRVTGPRGASSLEQDLLGEGAKLPVAAAFTVPLKIPVAAVGRYSVSWMTWQASARSSGSGSFSFAIGTPEQLEAYDAELERFDEAERAKAAAADAAPADADQ